MSENESVMVIAQMEILGKVGGEKWIWGLEMLTVKSSNQCHGLKCVLKQNKNT